MAKKQAKKKTPTEELVGSMQKKKRTVTSIAGKLYGLNERMKKKKQPAKRRAY